MDWGVLAPTLVGGGLALLGGFGGQWWSERRAVAREEREREHEREVWSRAQRRDAYAAFMLAFTTHWGEVSKAANAEPEQPVEFSRDWHEAMANVDLFGSRAASDKASELFVSLLKFGTRHDRGIDTLGETMRIHRELREQVRLDLGLSE